MYNADRVKLLCGIAIAAIVTSAVPTYAQDANSAPNPYRLEEGWAKQPMGRGNGSTIGLNVDRDGKSMWFYDRCGGNSCEGSKIAPLNKYDASGRVVASLGAGMTNFRMACSSIRTVTSGSPTGAPTGTRRRATPS